MESHWADSVRKKWLELLQAGRGRLAAEGEVRLAASEGGDFLVYPYILTNIYLQ